jgi:predicted phage baseplate assembly protein
MSGSRERLAAFGQALTASQLARLNPPGLDAVSYRVATYQNALARMLARLPVETVAPEDDLGPPLAHLNLEADDDWAVALLHAWAVVTDVLSFYQERVINEGYLRTATERRSVLELARSIGYELRPGVAASTHLAVTVQVSQDEPPRQVDVPARTAVQGMPASGQLPQVFETSQAFTARSEWNFLRLASEDRPGTIWPGTTSIRLAGGRVDLQVGGPILIVGDDGAAAEAGRRWLLVTLSAVQFEPGKDYTLVAWRDAIGRPGPHLPLHNARLFAPRQLGGLFGYTQAAVDYVPAAGDRWWPAGIGLPQVEVHALASSAQGHLFAGTAQDVFRSADGGASWQPAPTGPLRKNVTALALDAGGALYAGTDEGGIYLSQDDGHNWTAMSGEDVVPPPKRLKKWLPFLFSAPLPKTTVRSLVIYPQRRQCVLVAGTDDGVFRSMDQGKTWQPSNFDLSGLDWKTGRAKTAVWALAVAKRGWRRHLFAGTDGGAFRVTGSPRFWPLLIVNLILVLVLRALINKGSLVAHLLGWVKGVRDELGAFFFHTLPELLFSFLQENLRPINDFIKNLPDTWPNLPEPWDVLNAPLTFLIDFLLAVAVVALLFFIVKSIDRFINSRSRRCLGLPVYALAVGAHGQLFAGTERGVYRSYGPKPRQDGNWLGRLLSRLKIRLLQSLIRDWRLVTEDETVQDVRALAVSPPEAVFAGTATGELFRSDEDGAEWYRFDHDLNLADVQAILAAQHGQFAAGTPLTDESERRWSLPQIEKGQIDLDQVVAAIAPQRWVVLQQGDDPDKAMLYQVLEATVTNSQDFNQVGQFTRLAVDANTALDAFDRETTAVWAGDEALALYDDRPVWGDTFALDRVVPGLEPAQRLVFSGKRNRVRLAERDGDLVLLSADGLQSAPLAAGELLHLMSPPRPVDAADGVMVQWHLKNRHGFVGSVEARCDAFALVPAAEEDETVAEVALVESVDHRQQATRITLRAALENVYDRSSLMIYGNVIHATHGRTVRDEVLGSGDGSQANQRFRLRQGPLTFVSAPTASGVETTLAVQINGVTWHQFPFLHGLDRDSRAYIVRQDARGNTSVIFGDGQHGARLPSGNEQITATYRIDIGPEGNMPAGSLNQLQTAPPGIESVTNPLPATGGVGPEKLARARQNAPLTVRAMRRVVSLADFEDFVRRFGGVGKAQARLLHVGPRDVLHITIADGEGQPIPKSSDLYRMLLQAIDENRGTPQPRVYVDSYEPVYFNLRARLLIDPDHRERQRDIQAAVRSKIIRSFAFNAREFGQDVSASELISLMQDTPGVVAVQLVHLYPSTQDPGLAAVLGASLARWHADGPLPAQMLLVNSQTGITLNVEVAA